MGKGVAIVRKTGLRRGQESLYRLIVEKLKTGDAITLKEAKNIWLHEVHNDHMWQGDKPVHYDYSVPVRDEAGELTGWTTKLVPYTEEEMLRNSMLWLTSNIGLLVIKGYLKVIPQIKLDEPKPHTKVEL